MLAGPGLGAQRAKARRKPGGQSGVPPLRRYGRVVRGWRELRSQRGGAAGGRADPENGISGQSALISRPGLPGSLTPGGAALLAYNRDWWYVPTARLLLHDCRVHVA